MNIDNSVKYELPVQTEIQKTIDCVSPLVRWHFL